MAKTIEFKLPDIGEGVAEGEITKWLVSEGDSVTEDQPMLEVMTDKATVEIGSPVDGRIQSIKAEEGATVPVGDVIVVLAEGAAGDDDGDDDDAAAAKSDKGGDGKGKSKSKSASGEADEADEGGELAGDPEGGGEGAGRQDDGGERKPAKASEDDSDSEDDDRGGDMEEVNFSLPDIGEGVAEGEITKWLVSEGDSVTEDQPMLEVMTDKATVEIGSPVDGKVLEIVQAEGSTVPVGETLLILGATGSAPKIKSHGKSEGGKSSKQAAAKSDDDESDESDESKKSKKSKASDKSRERDDDRGRSAGRTSTGGTRADRDDDGGGTAVATAPRASTLSDTGLPDRRDGTRRVRAAPAVRRFARESGVEIGSVEGSGPEGRVTMDDVRSAARGGGAGGKAPARGGAARPAAAASPAPAPKPAELQGDERVPLRGLRKVIAKQMRVAKQTAAHFSYIEEIDVTDLVALRKESKPVAADRGVKLSYMPYIIKASCMALRDFPILNASLDEEAQEIVYHHEINMGIAVDTPNGLVVPVIRNADRNSMLENSRVMNELAERARDGKTKQDDIGGGTFTITNAGNIGGLLATPVINVPEVAIMGVHKISRRPWVVDDQIVIRDIMYLSLSLDHRVVDGAVGAYFMNRVKELLESPGLMLLES